MIVENTVTKYKNYEKLQIKKNLIMKLSTTRNYVISIIKKCSLALHLINQLLFFINSLIKAYHF